MLLALQPALFPGKVYLLFSLPEASWLLVFLWRRNMLLQAGVVPQNPVVTLALWVLAGQAV